MIVGIFDRQGLLRVGFKGEGVSGLPLHYCGGLPYDPDGRLMQSASLLAQSVYYQGLRLTSDDGINWYVYGSDVAVSAWCNGLPFASLGLLATTYRQTAEYFYNGLPFYSNGRISCMPGNFREAQEVVTVSDSLKVAIA